MNQYQQGALDAIKTIHEHIQARVAGLDAIKNSEIGALGMATDITNKMTEILQSLEPCKYCQDFPCRCEAIDAQRDYGRPEYWNGNDY